eukprot:scaffold6532_cov116-Isochrysis_galbana.AAC.7
MSIILSAFVDIVYLLLYAPIFAILCSAALAARRPRRRRPLGSLARLLRLRLAPSYVRPPGGARLRDCARSTWSRFQSPLASSCSCEAVREPSCAVTTSPLLVWPCTRLTGERNKRGVSQSPDPCCLSLLGQRIWPTRLHMSTSRPSGPGACCPSLSALRLARLVQAGRCWKAAGSAVGDPHVRLPRQAVSTCCQIRHVRVRAVLRAALHRHIPSVAKLVDIILNAPAEARLADEVRPNLCGDDLVRARGRPMRENRPVEVDDHSFAHAVKGAVAAAHADVRGHHEIAERVGLVGEAPRLARRSRVACRPEHDLGALVSAFASHLGEHAIMANDERQPAPVWAVDDGNANVARLPRLHRHPRVQLPVV